MTQNVVIHFICMLAMARCQTNINCEKRILFQRRKENPSPIAHA